MSDFAAPLPSILVAALGEPLTYIKGDKRFEIDGIPGRKQDSLEGSAAGESIFIGDLCLSIDGGDVPGGVSSRDQVVFRDKTYEIQYPMPYANGMVKIHLIEVAEDD